MGRLILFVATLLLTNFCSAQITVSNLDFAPQENHVLRYDVTFDTDADCYAYLDYFRVHLDSLDNPVDTTWYKTNLQGPASTFAFIMEGLVADQPYGFIINAFNTSDCLAGAVEPFVTDTLPEIIPSMDTLYVNPEADLSGYYITNTVATSDGTFQIYNRDGEVVWYDYHSGEPNVGNTAQCQMYNVTVDDHLLILECHTIEERDLSGNTLNLIDFTGEDVDSIYLHHDVIINSAGNYVAVGGSATEYPSGDSTIKVVQEHLLEFTPAGELVWQWNAYDHYDPYNAVPSNGFYTPIFGADAINWMHVNTVMQDSDGHYIISVKEWDACLKINSESGDVMWQLGGEGADIEFFPADHFGDQHQINRTAVGTYIMYDNTGLDTLSRILEFSLDFYDDPVAINEWEYVLPAANFSNILGSAERLPGGNRYAGSGVSGGIIEVNSAGEVLWHFEQSSWLYRCFFIENPFETASIEDITMGTNPTLMCETEDAIALDAMPMGGYWSGNGVEDGMFDPQVAGLGTHELTYKWGWNTATISIEVSDAVPPCEVSVDEQSVALIANIYPNPVSDQLNVEMSSVENQRVVVRVLDLTGQVVYSNQHTLVTGTNLIQVETSDLAAGMYTLSVAGDHAELTETFVVSR
ncbi:MAG: aryl-sulfate sulfotransferase [Flavobacteriales bacterium]|nr:aryl-sulfate sulfotransferase [Flavobacteriales bacterium]